MNPKLKIINNSTLINHQPNSSSDYTHEIILYIQRGSACHVEKLTMLSEVLVGCVTFDAVDIK